MCRQFPALVTGSLQPLPQWSQTISSRPNLLIHQSRLPLLRWRSLLRRRSSRQAQIGAVFCWSAHFWHLCSVQSSLSPWALIHLLPASFIETVTPPSARLPFFLCKISPATQARNTSLPA